MFELHPQLAQDTLVLGDAPLCRVLLMGDANYPWVILVPRRDGLRELHELDDAGQAQLLRELNHLTRGMQSAFRADKMNLAALGNMVPQLHIHVIARHVGDPAWPRPVWGTVPPRTYRDDELQERVSLLTALVASLAAA